MKVFLRKLKNKLTGAGSSSVDQFSVKQEYGWLEKQGIGKILDIGANEGQFVEKMRSQFPAVPIISFEPIPSVYQNLVKRFEGDSNFKAHNVALGDTNTSSVIHLNEYSPSSSILPMKDEHKKQFEFTKREEEVTIQIKRLDDFENLITTGEIALVKVDVQGYEQFVIKGGRNTLSLAKIIIIEVSFTELYETQPLFDDIYQELKDLGFKYSGNFEQLMSPHDGEILQADAIFIKE